MITDDLTDAVDSLEESLSEDATPATDETSATDDVVAGDDSTSGDDSTGTAAQGDGDTSDAAFVEYVVKQIVENPDAVKINRTVDEMGVLITLEVDKDDMGKIIGKSGQTAKALRILLRIIGSKHNARVNLKIVEPDEVE